MPELIWRVSSNNRLMHSRSSTSSKKSNRRYLTSNSRSTNNNWWTRSWRTLLSSTPLIRRDFRLIPEMLGLGFPGGVRRWVLHVARRLVGRRSMPPTQPLVG